MKEKGHPACYDWTVQKSTSLVQLNSIKKKLWYEVALDHRQLGNLHIWQNTINAEKYIEVLEQHMLPFETMCLSGKPLHISARRY